MFHFHIGTTPEELRAIMARLTRIEGKLDAVTGKEHDEMALIDDLVAKVALNTSVIESAKIAFKGLADQLKAAGTDPVKLQALITQLSTDDAGLSDAIAASTPDAPAATV